ncbi:hypothetical protein TcWFU_009043 [Taenia crassiceps]|uniref:Uncharacterized protein n=1 Tax=Taenia crassiceps TaxID=6207 RepID=A0ABR4Q630_9CEST
MKFIYTSGALNCHAGFVVGPISRASSSVYALTIVPLGKGRVAHFVEASEEPGQSVVKTLSLSIEMPWE